MPAQIPDEITFDYMQRLLDFKAVGVALARFNMQIELNPALAQPTLIYGLCKLAAANNVLDTSLCVNAMTAIRKIVEKAEDADSAEYSGRIAISDLSFRFNKGTCRFDDEYIKLYKAFAERFPQAERRIGCFPRSLDYLRPAPQLA